MAYTTSRYHYTDFQHQDFTTPPDKPLKPSGNTYGKVGVNYNYETRATDVDGDDLWYFWDWGNGKNSGWIGPYDSDETVICKYNWSTNGTCNVRVQAIDIYGIKSPWSDPLEVSMSKTKIFNIHDFLISYLNDHPLMFPILRQLLGLD